MTRSGLGPVTVEQVREFPRDSRQPVTVKPVIDLADQSPADAYETSAPMTRLHHRVKTHGRWQLRQPESNVYLWRSPHGRYFRVDALGTHRLAEHAGEAAWHATGDGARPMGLEARRPDTSPIKQAFKRMVRAAS